MRLQSKPTELTLKGLELRVSALEKWPKRLIGAYGVTFAGLLAFAFFLGSLHTKVSESSDKVDKLYGVVAIDKDSLLSRVGVIEHRLSSIECRLNSMHADLKELKELVRSREQPSGTAKPLPRPLARSR